MSLPPEQRDPLDQLLAEAKRRGRRRRTLRRAGFGAGGLFVAAAILIAAVLLTSGPAPTQLNVVSPRSPSPVRTSISSPAPKASPSPTSPVKTPRPTAPGGGASPSAPAAGGPPMYFDSIAFGTPLDGWAAGIEPMGTGNGVVVSHSNDGGLRWSPAVTVSTSEVASPQVRFVDALHGWITGAVGRQPAAAGGVPDDLLVTNDGGQTWTDTGLSGVAGAVAPAGGTVWALQYPCSGVSACIPRLIESVLPDGAWGQAPHQPPLVAGQATLLRVTAAEAFITLTSLNPQAAGMLVRTLDGGARWQTLPDPCGPGTQFDPLASLDGTTVWMACGGQPGAGSEDKQIYVSTDGGLNWTLKASAGLGAASPGALPGIGYASELALTSATTGFLALSRYGLATSSDGGSTWRELGAWDGAGGDFHGLWFVDPSHGWAAACDGLHRTTDGGVTWSLIGTWPAGGECGG